MAQKISLAKVRGVYERDLGSGIWWIRFTDNGKIRRERVGRRSDAIALYQKRKADARAGIMLPSNLRQRPFNIAELGRTRSSGSKTTMSAIFEPSLAEWI